MRRIALNIFVLLIAHNVFAISKNDSISLKQRIQETKIAQKTHNIVDRIIDRYTTQNATDTVFVVKNDYRLQVRPELSEFNGFTYFDWNSLREDLPQDCKITSEPIAKVGLTLGYRCLSIGYSIDITMFNPNKRPKTREFNLSFYGEKFGIDYSLYKSEQHSFEFHDSSDELASGEVKSKRWQLNTYYVFNHRRFSYPAAITQSYVQNRTAGSPIVGFSLYNMRLYNTKYKLPDEMIESLGEYIFPSSVEYLSFNLNAGYAENFVTRCRHVLLHISLIPDIALFRKSKVEPHPILGSIRENYISYGGVCRLSALWQRENHYFGLVGIFTLHTITSVRPMWTIDAYARVSLFYGFRAYKYKR